MKIKAYCDVCNPIGSPVRTKPIGMFEAELTKIPLTGCMFTSIDPDHGYPPPFHVDAVWDYLWCPFSPLDKPHRAFTDPDKIRTENGYYIVGEKLKRGKESKNVR